MFGSRQRSQSMTDALAGGGSVETGPFSKGAKPQVQINDMEGRRLAGIDANLQRALLQRENAAEQQRQEAAMLEQMGMQRPEILQKMLGADRPGQLMQPQANLNQRAGYSFRSNPAIFGRQYPGEEDQELQDGEDNDPSQEVVGAQPEEGDEKMSAIEMRTPNGAARFIAMTTRLPFVSEELQNLYSNQLAGALDDTTSIYNPISSNPYQRLAYVLKTRMRQESLYGRMHN